MVQDLAQMTILNILGYIQILGILLLLWEIFYHLVPVLKGDDSILIKARERVTRQRLLEVRSAERREKAEEEAEINDEQQLIVLLRKVQRDLHEHGVKEIDDLLKDLQLVRNNLVHLEQLERKEKQDFKEHLEGLPNSEKLKAEIGEEGKLTLLIEKLILASEEMLVSKANPAQIETYIVKAIQIAERLIQMEQAEEKEL
ncbi:hypothetical protein J4434_08945 [Candidatus Woesearchaeota archaeon]|nr:hypothetical protein [Candidatus Woesearchaeota archaeon]